MPVLVPGVGLGRPFYQVLARSIEVPLGRAHRRPSIFDRRVWVPMCEEEHAIGNLRPLETIIMSYLFREGMVLCLATRRGAFCGNDDEINRKNFKMQVTFSGFSH